MSAAESGPRHPAAGLAAGVRRTMAGVAMLEGLALLALVGLLVFGAITLATRGTGRTPPALTQGPARWRTGHYAASGHTRIVVQRVAPDGAVVDEHVVATVPEDDPDYDALFLEGMARARQRVALYEAEEG